MNDINISYFNDLPHKNIKKVYDSGIKKYTKNDWRVRPIEEDIQHAKDHLVNYFEKDEKLEDLEHAICRLFFLLQKKIDQKK